jgi:hypothetical protein
MPAGPSFDRYGGGAGNRGKRLHRGESGVGGDAREEQGVGLGWGEQSVAPEAAPRRKEQRGRDGEISVERNFQRQLKYERDRMWPEGNIFGPPDQVPKHIQ